MPAAVRAFSRRFLFRMGGSGGAPPPCPPTASFSAFVAMSRSSLLPVAEEIAADQDDADHEDRDDEEADGDPAAPA